MKYIEWPETQKHSDFVVAIMGDSPIIKDLQTLASVKKLNGRKIVIKKITLPAEAADCHLLYISSSKSSALALVKESCKNKPILLVGEREGLAKKGAGLSFVTLDDDGLNFDINQKEIEQHQLKVSSSLISLGNVVK